MVAQAGKKRPQSEAHGGKRAQIIEHCARLFDKGSYHDMSMQMLADEVGLSKPTLYHYFPSKVSILYAIHDTYINNLMDGLGHKAGDDPLDSLKNSCVEILKQIATHPGYVRAFMDHYGELEGEMKKGIRAARQTYFEEIRKLIAEGIASGQFREVDPLMTTYAFVGMCNWAYKWYPSMAAERSPEMVADALCDPFFNGLKAQ